MAKKPASRAERYQRLCREAAKLLGAKASDDRCAHYATLKLAREAAATKLIAGQDVDPAVLLRLDESLQAFMPPPPIEPLVVKVVDGTRKTCPFCQATFDPHDPDPKLLPPRELYGEVLPPAPAAPPPKRALPPPPKPRPSIHDMPGSPVKDMPGTAYGGRCSITGIVGQTAR